MSKRILVVEDQDLRAIPRDFLSVSGYTVIEAVDGAESVAEAASERCRAGHGSCARIHQFAECLNACARHHRAGSNASSSRQHHHIVKRCRLSSLRTCVLRTAAVFGTCV
jgi:CheY-like chemotaxis protein